VAVVATDDAGNRSMLATASLDPVPGVAAPRAPTDPVAPTGGTGALWFPAFLLVLSAVLAQHAHKLPTERRRRR
jgi:hypothetical protein